MTLIELLVVMVIMAIIMGISVPAFIGIGRGAGMRNAVNSVCSTLALTRQWAITHREQTFFSYGNHMGYGFYEVTNQNGYVMARVTNNDVLFEPPTDGWTNCINFKSDGGLAMDGGVTNVGIGPAVPGVGSAIVTVSVYVLTGTAKIQE